MTIFENHLSIVVICWFILFIYWIVSAFFVKRSVTKYNIKAAIFWRLVFAVLVIIFVNLDRTGAIMFLGFLMHKFFSLHVLGAVLTALGLIVAIWARISLGRNWSSFVTYKKEHELVMSGPYKFVRHPIYSGVLLMLLGTFIYYGNFIILLFTAVATIFVSWRMIREEKIMISLFGDKYLDYMKKSQRLIPWVY